MKQLTCEMCGGTDLVKDGGVFVCQTCGCKYSIEEARKMMVEGTVEVTGTVKVDDSAKKREKIDNYLEMAKTALEGEDVEGVVSYCDRILELDHDNYEAWVLRAKVAGWGSTLRDIKVPQALTAAKRAVNLAPDLKKYDVAAEVLASIKSQIVALLSIAQSMPGVTGCEYIQKVMVQWQSVLVGIPYLRKSVLEAEINDCRELCETSKHAFSPKARLVYSSYFVYNHNVSYDKMFEDALAEKIKLEGEREQEFNMKAKAEAEARKAEYWAAHAELKEKLEFDKATAKKRIEELLAEYTSIAESAHADELKAKIDDLTKQIDSLGLFKGKEKKALQAQIDSIEADLGPIKAIIAKKKSAIQAQINDQKRVIENVEVELAKER